MELVPCGPERGNAGEKQDEREQHSDFRAAAGAPPKRHEDEEIDGSVFEKINAVGEQRYGHDQQRDGELDSEIAEVQQPHNQVGPRRGIKGREHPRNDNRDICQ